MPTSTPVMETRDCNTDKPSDDASTMGREDAPVASFEETLTKNRREMRADADRRRAEYIASMEKAAMAAVPPRVRLHCLISEAHRYHAARFDQWDQDEAAAAAKLPKSASTSAPATNRRLLAAHRETARRTFAHMLQDVKVRSHHVSALLAGHPQRVQELHGFSTAGLNCFAAILPWSHSITCATVTAHLPTDSRMVLCQPPHALPRGAGLAAAGHGKHAAVAEMRRSRLRSFSPTPKTRTATPATFSTQPPLRCARTA